MKKVLFSCITLLSFANFTAQEFKFGVKAGANMSTGKYEVSEITVGGFNAVGENQDSKFIPGFQIGGFAELEISEKFALQAELQYSTNGTKFVENSTETQYFDPTDLTNYLTLSNNSETKLKTSSLNIPLLAKYNFTDKIYVIAGPQLSLLLTAKSKPNGYATQQIYFGGVADPLDTEVVSLSSPEFDAKDGLKGFNVSASLGGGFNFTENIFVEARYNLGLLNEAKSSTAVIGTTIVNLDTTYKTSSILLSVGYRF